MRNRNDEKKDEVKSKRRPVKAPVPRTAEEADTAPVVQHPVNVLVTRCVMMTMMMTMMMMKSGRMVGRMGTTEEFGV
jgi:hypothetical protein